MFVARPLPPALSAQVKLTWTFWLAQVFATYAAPPGGLVAATLIVGFTVSRTIVSVDVVD